MMIGTVVGGCVSSVTTDSIVVTLPERMVGYVPLTQVSKPYSQLLAKVSLVYNKIIFFSHTCNVPIASYKCNS